MARRAAILLIPTFIVSTVCVAAPTVSYEPPAGAIRSGRLALDGGSVLATHPASGSVSKVRTTDGTIAWTATLGCTPAGIAVVGTSAAVACTDSGEVVVLDDAGRIARRRHVGHGAFGALYAGRLFVTLAHEDIVVALDPSTLVEVARAPTGPLPKGLALKDDTLYVVHGSAAGVSRFDARGLRPLGAIELGQQAGVAESLTPHPERPRLYVAHTRLNVTNLARQFDTTVFPVIASIDLESNDVVRREALSLDSVDTPVGMPLAVAIDTRRERLWSANAASNDVSVVDLTLGIGVGHIDVGQRPRDIVFSADGARAYTLDEVGATITVIDTTKMAVVATYQHATDARPQTIREGERLFTTSRPPTLARDRWLSCSTCHLDGGMDGATWLGTEGGPRNTPTLRGIAGTEPFHWSGDRPDIASFNATITDVMQGTGLSAPEIRSLAAFLESLRPLPSPKRDASGALTAQAESGAAVFQRAGCGSCHGGPLFTDQQLHDVGTGEPSGPVPERAGPRFKTPSLRELWLTAPYLHDGRAATLEDAIAMHTRTRLIGSELVELEAFLLQLPLSGAEYARLFGR